MEGKLCRSGDLRAETRLARRSQASEHGGRAPQGRSSRCCTQRRFARVSTRNKVRMAGAQRDSSAGNESEKSKKGSCRNRQECVGIVQARDADLWAGGGNRDGAEYLAFRARAFIDF